MITQEQVNFFNENGYLKIENVFTPEETQALSDDMDWLMEEWAAEGAGWTGPWRNDYMDKQTEKKSKLIAMHDLYYYSRPWNHAVNNKNLVDSISKILGPDVEFHHSTMHVKPHSTGHPFPMHQDWAFYKHDDNRYVDVLVHLDDTCHENGEIRFIPKSNKLGALEHIEKTESGPCTPHLKKEEYDLKDSIAVPAKKGDVVLFNIFTIHGSYINQTKEDRRMVRMGYRHPQNKQYSGQSLNRPGVMVAGRRRRSVGEDAFSTEIGENNTLATFDL